MMATKIEDTFSHFRAISASNWITTGLWRVEAIARETMLAVLQEADINNPELEARIAKLGADTPIIGMLPLVPSLDKTSRMPEKPSLGGGPVSWADRLFKAPDFDCRGSGAVIAGDRGCA